MNLKLNEAYWTERYINQTDFWDLGEVSPPLKEYVNQLNDKSIDILIPGCGNGYEGEHLHQAGFNNVRQMDLSQLALDNFHNRVPSFPKDFLICSDFFEHEGTYDLILEQTFFCALYPSLREKYVQHACKILKPKGKIAGLLFDDPLNNDKPPFGGNQEEYEKLFSPYFHLHILETAHNSVKPRAGREFFILFEKK